MTAKMSCEVGCNRSSDTKRKFHPTPVPLSLILGFPWLLGTGIDEREWLPAPWGHRQPPFTPLIGRIHTSLN